MSFPNAHTRFTEQRKAYARGNMEIVRLLAEEAKQELQQSGLVKTDLLGWIEKDWLQKGLDERTIVKRIDGYVPAVTEREEDMVTSYRGRTPISKGKKLVLSIIGFSDFLRRYEEYKLKKEQQEYVINKQLTSLIEGGEK